MLNAGFFLPCDTTIALQAVHLFKQQSQGTESKMTINKPTSLCCSSYDQEVRQLEVGGFLHWKELRDRKGHKLLLCPEDPLLPPSSRQTRWPEEQWRRATATQLCTTTPHVSKPPLLGYSHLMVTFTEAPSIYATFYAHSSFLQAPFPAMLCSLPFINISSLF